MGTAARGETAETRDPLTIDELARRAGLPVRTIREYHTMRLLPPPQRRGRVGLFRDPPPQPPPLLIPPPRPGYSLARLPAPLPGLASGNHPGYLLRVRPGPAAPGPAP